MMGSDAKGRTVMEVGADGVALITIIYPPVNALSFDGTFFRNPTYPISSVCLFSRIPISYQSYVLCGCFVFCVFFSSQTFGWINFGTLCACT